MNVVGIVTEHNPFHNGHLYHVEKAREKCNADLVISVMSGHFLQRGEPALFNKWARAKMAVLSGVDIVIELPTAFSVRSASTFAHGAVSLLESTGVISHICFGSESGDVEDLWPAARLLAKEPIEFQKILHNYLKTGLPFPSARAKAMVEYFSATGKDGVSEGLYSKPNIILGIEYLKSLLTLKSSIKPVAIERFAAGYHDLSLDHPSEIASATSIREEMIVNGKLTEKIKSVVPAATLEVMEKEIREGEGPVFLKDYSKILFYLLRTLSQTQLRTFYDVTEGLENRIFEASRSAGSVHELIKHIKTKRYTWTRIQRILSYIMLGYTKSLAEAFDSTGPRYIRVLGLSDRGRTLFRLIKKRASLPVITITSPFLSQNNEISSMLQFDVKATDIYTLLLPDIHLSPQGLDCKIMPFVLY